MFLAQIGPSCELPLSCEGGGVAGGAQGVPVGPIAPTSYITDRLERVGPAGTVGATYNFPFLNPLEPEFEKVVLQKM